MFFERGDHATQHQSALGFGGLLDLDQLEAARQGGILFEVLLVLGPGGGGDGAQFAAGEGRLEQVGGVVLAGLAARADHGVGLVDEQDDRRGRGLDLVDQSLEAVFEFALDARPGLQQREIESPHGDVLQHRRHVALRDAQREALDYGGLADAGFADQNGVVLTPAGENIDHLADLGIARQHGVHFALAGVLGQVDGVLIEVGGLAAGAGPRRAFRRGGFGGRHFLAFGGIGDDRQEVLLEGVGRDLLQLSADLAHDARQLFIGDQRQDGEAGADARGPEVDRADGPGLREHLQQRRAQGRRARVAGLEFVEAARQFRGQARLVDAELLQDEGEVSIARIEQFHQVMLDFDVIVSPGQAESRGSLQRQARRVVQFRDE